MKKSLMASILSMAAAAGLNLAFSSAPAEGKAKRGSRRRAEHFTQNGVVYKRTWHRRYPEQSSRQQMRRYRRAQGGPGIYLNQQEGCYLPVGCPTVESFVSGSWRQAA